MLPPATMFLPFRRQPRPLSTDWKKTALVSTSAFVIGKGIQRSDGRVERGEPRSGKLPTDVGKFDCWNSWRRSYLCVVATAENRKKGMNDDEGWEEGRATELRGCTVR